MRVVSSGGLGLVLATDADAWDATISDDYRGWGVQDAGSMTKAEAAP